MMQKIPTLIPVVAAALIRADGQVLMQRRKRAKAHGGLWEFPGGKVEMGESPEAALVREIGEELGLALNAEALEPLTFASDPAQPPLPRQPHVILLYICRSWTGEPLCLDGEEIGWFPVDALSGLDMPPLDYPLARALKNAK
jgi:8-oxo-dGTP diphosphatase